MLNRIIFWSIQNKLIVAVLTFFLIVWGLFSLQQLPIDAVPDITNNQIQIITQAPSSGAEDIERFVTFPVEQTMATIPEIEEIRSFSRFGLSVVTIVFDEKTDIYWARQQVAERLNEAKSEIPEGFGTPSLAPLSSGLGEIYQYTIHAKEGYEKNYNSTELRTIQDWVIRRQLLGVKGVADVSGFGGNLKTYEIAVDPYQLKALNLTISDLFQAVNQNNENTGGAYIERNNLTTYIRTEGLLQSIDDISSIVVKDSETGQPILVRDVAEVKMGTAVRYGALTLNGEGEAVGGIVMMLKGANSSEVIQRVKDKMEQIKSTLPKGIEVNVYLDRTDLVNRAIKTVGTNLTEGALIVIFVLVLLLGNLRAGLIVASVIPLAMLFAISLMNVFGVSGNLMSLGALDFGLIVDGAVIIVESTLHFIHLKGKHHLTREELGEEVYHSASKFSKSAVFGQIIILVVYLPILALVGIEGKMFKPMAQTVMFAILGALILSLTYIPMISSIFLSKKVNLKETLSDKIVDRIKHLYQPILRFVLKKNKAILVGILGLLVLSLMVFGKLGAEFIPSLDEGDFAVETRLMTGSGLTKTIDATNKASALLMEKFPEVKQVVGKIGTAEIPTDPMPMEACDLMVILQPKDTWTSANTKEELAEKMQQVLDEKLPGVSFGFQQPIQMRFNELMTGAKQDVVVKIYGEDFEKLDFYAKKMGKLANEIEGVQDVYVEEMDGLPQMIVRYNRQALALHQVSVQEVNNVVNLGFAGQSKGQIFEGEKRFDLVVKLQSDYRENLDDLKNLFVTSKTGKLVPIEELAEITLETGPNQIQRDDAKRRILVGFNIRGRDVESIVRELKSKVDQHISFEAGYFTTYGGTFKNLENARNRLLIAVPAALLLIFFLLYLTFQSLKQALLIFSAIPLAAIGGIFALYFRDMPFSISAGVGFIALFGVAVLNGIVLITEFNNLKNSGENNILKVILLGTNSRIRPVLLTALVASLGFLPMALSHGSGAEVQKPLATVVIGGLITATLLTLFILPILYLITNKELKIKNINATTLIFILYSSGHFFAQNQMDLNALKKTLEEKNGIYQSQVLAGQREEYSAAANIFWGKTNADLMVGQFNSHYSSDNNIALSHTIPFPTIASAEKSLGNAKSNLLNINASWTLLQLQQQLELSFDSYQFIHQKRSYLQEQDSILNGLYQRMLVRKELQDITKLELSLVASRLKKIQNEVFVLEKELEREKFRIAELIQVKPTDFQIEIKDYSLQILQLENTGNFENHVLMNAFKAQEEILNQEKKVALARQLPDISVGYFNQTLVGFQNVNGQEKYFSSGDRFQGGTIGLSIPLFWNNYQNRVKAIQTEAQQIELAKNNLGISLQQQFQQRMSMLQALQQSKILFDTQLLPESILMQTENELHFQTGEHSMIEFLHIRDQVKQIEMDALVNQFNLNQLTIELNYFLKGTTIQK